MPNIRLQRYMADCGVAARRECEQMIADGRVKVNGRVVRALPVFVDPAQDIIMVDEDILEAATPEGQEKVYYLLNKPKGILVTNFDPSERKTVGELMPGVNERVFPVGRLDMDSRGLLLMTNDGELAHRLTHPRYGIEKTYIVEVEGRMSPEDVERVKRGAWLGPDPGKARRGPVRGERTARFHIRIIGRERGRTLLEVKVAESRNREIRRVMARIGHPVRDLNRVAIAERITIRNLPVGSYRPLSSKEVEWLYQASSPESHDRDRAATQQWYEQKEMEKERRRLADEAQAQTEREQKQRAQPQRAQTQRTHPERQRRAGAAESTASAPARKFRERPLRKGKKPFVPPTGRNAGKMLGGDKLGRRNLEVQQRQHENAPPMETPRPQHPLGGAAHDDE